MFLDSKPQKILVMGDIMLDYKITGSINKLANEAPIPVFLREKESIHLGGCGNVLQNLVSMGCEELYLFSMCGDDEKKDTLYSLLKDISVHFILIENARKKTTSKHRFFCQNKLVFRYDDEEYTMLQGHEEKDILIRIQQLIQERKIDCILFSDYNKGFLTPTLCQSVIEMANEAGIFTCVDPKNDYKKYRNCSLLKPNRNEVETLFGIHFTIESLPEIHRTIKALTGCKNTVITLGDLGISGCFESNEYFYWKHESKDVIDVTGAGDVVNSILALYFDQSIEKGLCLQLASYLATISVSHLGTYTLQFSDILMAYKFLTKNKTVSVKDLIKLNRPFLFTNGCFDILHEGHISLFQYCRGIAGNKYDIVLGLNSDESIRHLKGEDRPICPLQTRLAILNSIEYIDWIIVFEEDTPEEVLKLLKPDILVKGGDYTIDTLVGKDYCKEVKLFPFTYNISTSNIVNRIKQSRRS